MVELNYQKPKGTADILPGESQLWEKVENIAEKTFREYGYRGIRTPIFEDYNVFARNVGDTSDIVEKQMYDFMDKGGRRLALRPEGTAGVVRSYVENKLFGPEYPKPYKVYYMGPMFRYERPQSGRQRQFTQIGCEALNSESPQIDVEVISEAIEFFHRLGIDNLKLAINSLGDNETRENYRKSLIEYLEPFYDELSEDSKSRLYKNPLRVLDSKDKNDKKIVENAPSILDSLNDYSLKYFNEVKSLLDELNISYEIDSNMVRGLDYYTHTIFEIMSDSDAFGGDYVTVCGGGRYNGLISQLGGPDEGGIGYGIGVERLLILIQKENPDIIPNDSPDIFFAAADKEGDNLAFTILDSIRKKGIFGEKNYQDRKLKSQIKEAFRVKAKYYAVIGKKEVESGEFQISKEGSSETKIIKINDFKDNPQKFLN
ncbi:histidine--tRNA ligase [Lentilactobacillus kribbianus]|uniref:histidine--tRNA ligase n=1 Tax=Lentilactobacillus kribbianus TaxID=2729622 RepID=UPI0015565070|nr:histidine--tRNA ligase [Lentilactobacillus kribbianus]